MALADTPSVLEAQNFSDLTHRQSLAWHGAPRCCSGERAVDWRLLAVRLATLRGWPTSSESVAGLRRNQWPEWIGINGRFASEYAPVMPHSQKDGHAPQGCDQIIPAAISPFTLVRKL